MGVSKMTGKIILILWVLNFKWMGIDQSPSHNEWVSGFIVRTSRVCMRYEPWLIKKGPFVEKPDLEKYQKENYCYEVTASTRQFVVDYFMLTEEESK